MKIATKNMWKTFEMENYTKLDTSIIISKNEFSNLIKGIVPMSMDDKWFVYFEKEWLHLHRSWTGIEIFKFRIIPKNEYLISEICIAKGFHNFEKELDCIDDLKQFNFIIKTLIGRDIF